LSGLPFEGAANSMLDSAEQDFTAEIPMITQSLTDAGNAARGEFGRLAGQLPAEAAAATKTTFDNRVIDTNANLATAISGNTQAGAIAAAFEFGDIRSEAGPYGGTGYWSATPGENLGIFVSPDGSYWSGYYDRVFEETDTANDWVTTITTRFEGGTWGFSHLLYDKTTRTPSGQVKKHLRLERDFNQSMSLFEFGNWSDDVELSMKYSNPNGTAPYHEGSLKVHPAGSASGFRMGLDFQKMSGLPTMYHALLEQSVPAGADGTLQYYVEAARNQEGRYAGVGAKYTNASGDDFRIKILTNEPNSGDSFTRVAKSFTVARDYPDLLGRWYLNGDLGVDYDWSSNDWVTVGGIGAGYSRSGTDNYFIIGFDLNTTVNKEGLQGIDTLLNVKFRR
jgi:hypothetical protein